MGDQTTRPLNAGSLLVRPAPLEWVCLLAGLWLTLEYAWLLDDAYVYFRYVDNWVWLGNGLVYNRGEFVEGYTSPMWVLLLGLLRLTGIDYWLLVRVVGLVCFSLFWALLVVLNRRLSPDRAPILNAPLLLLGLNYGVLCYFTSGVESPLTLLLAPACALFVLSPGALPLQLALSVAPLVRPELALVCAAGLAWSWLKLGRPPWRMAFMAASLSGAWMLFRIHYYADLFPNTFYLKDASEWLQGFRYLSDTALAYGGSFAVLAALGLAVSVRNDRRSLALPERAVMLAMAALVALYAVRVGGDGRHFRYFALPFALVACASGGILETALAAWTTRSRRALAAALGVGMASLVALQHPRQTVGHPLWSSDAPLILDGIADAEHHRRDRRLPSLDPWQRASALREVAERVASSPPGELGYRNVRVSYICWEFYDHLESRAVHSLGLTEPVLARVALRFDRPGHKWSLIALGRDLRRILRWWDRDPAPGMFRAAVEAGVAPDWVASNRDGLEAIERKIYNRHRFFENVAIAFARPIPIHAFPAREEAE